MSAIVIRQANEKDFQAIVELNDSEVQHTSAMDINRLEHLHSLASYHGVAIAGGVVAAFLLAMEDHAPYENDNFGWFSARHEKFLYIDRIVVGFNYQGRGIGKLLYADLIDYARQKNIPLVTCEINSVPPNQRSAAFHAGLGFTEVGSQWICEGQKQVSMQAITIKQI
jgi:uncharacterized protein